MIGVPLAKVATWVMLGHSLPELRETRPASDATPDILALPFTAVKEAVLPWGRFPGVDIILGPEMRSTGEVMGIDADFGRGVREGAGRGRHEAPAQRRDLHLAPRPRTSRRSSSRRRRLVELGFEIYSTDGTAELLQRDGSRRRRRSRRSTRASPTSSIS